MPDRMFAVLAVVLAAWFPAIAWADDWVAVKLRGEVVQLIDGEWAKLSRGDVVPDDRMIRTMRSGRVEFERDSETISLGANTEIQIEDRTGERYTTVQQHYGTVEIEAEVRNVQHFAVETPFLAAVVKGTRFIVESGDAQTSVEVRRGQVQVTDNKTRAYALVRKGLTATVTADGRFILEGRGASSTEVIGADGNVVEAGITGGGSGGGAGGSGIAASVNTPVGVGAGVAVGTGGVSVGAEVGDVADVGVSAGGGGGISADVNVGNTNVGVNVGGGNGVSVNVGKISLKLL